MASETKRIDLSASRLARRDLPLDERERVTEVVCETMEHVTEMRVPLVVDVGFGATWADAK